MCYFSEYEITDPVKSFLAQNSPAQIQLCFGEGLKDPTNQTVAQLKTMIEKIDRQNRTTHLIIYMLAVLLLLAGALVIYKFINQPFTTTIQICGWKGEQHNPSTGH